MGDNSPIVPIWVYMELNTIPHYITAPTKEALMKEMLKNNIKNNTRFQYFQISIDGGEYIAWYYKKVDLNVKKVN